jgi:cytochrome c-type biogenesis protein CcmH/NrfG
MPRTASVSFEKLAQPLRTLVQWSIPALFFLTPLVFAPFTTEALEMNKQVVLVVLVFLAAIGLLGNMLIERRVTLRGGWLVNVVPLVFLAAMLLSTIFSIAGVESWLGYGGQEYVSFLTAATGVALFYVLVNGSDTKLARRSLLALLLSSSIVGLLTLLSLVSIYLIPFAFTHSAGFNTVGNINAFVAWLIPISLAGLGFFLVDSDDEGSVIPGGATGVFTRILVAFVTFVTVLLLVAIDFWTLWAAFMVGLAALMFLSFLEPSHFPNMRRLAVPGVLFAIAVIFLFIKTPLKLQVPVVVSPSIGSSWDIAMQTLGQNPQSALFGSGPGSFDLDYARFRPVEVNTTIFWNTRFDRAQVHPLTVLATNGVVGLLSWLAFVLVVASFGLGRIIRGRQETEWRVNYALLAGWLSLFVLQLLTPFNMALTVLFWGLSGLLVAEAVSKTRQMSFADAPRAALGVTSGFALFVVIGLLTIFAMASRHTAEMAFAKAARLDAKGATPQELIDQMAKAVERDGTNSVFERNLATAYLAQAGVVVGEGVQDDDFGTEDKQKLAAVADASIRAAASAASHGENDAVNWAINGLIYRELMPFIQNAQNYAASMYVRALELEPNNAAYQTDLGRVYLAVADRAQEIQDLPDVDAEVKTTAATNEAENLRIAVENLEAAIRLKPDYAPAHYYVAAAYERQGNLDDASERLKALTQVQPNDVGLGFQLAVIYLKMDKSEEAEVELARILEVYPDYSNAMWYLAAIKANDGETAEALALLRRVEKLNPENTVVKESITNLEAGGPAPVDPAPIDAGVPPAVTP